MQSIISSREIKDYGDNRGNSNAADGGVKMIVREIAGKGIRGGVYPMMEKTAALILGQEVVMC